MARALTDKGKPAARRQEDGRRATLVRLEPEVDSRLRELMARERRGLSDQVNLLLAQALEGAAA